jgi:phosphatidylinositol-bisphosphatase
MLTAHVDKASISRLNLGPKNLNGTLILHTLMGKDHFISVTGTYGAFHDLRDNMMNLQC